MQYVTIYLQSHVKIDELIRAITLDGCIIHYEEEIPNGYKAVIGYIPQESSQELLKKYPAISQIEEKILEPIDWSQQWETHAFCMEEGKLSVDLKKLGCNKDKIIDPKPLILIPGPGFGDLSHPTTKLMIQLMEEHSSQKKVLDIGSGSGILSFAAMRFGALETIGVEIDLEAIVHAKKNAKLNEMEKSSTFILPQDLSFLTFQEIDLILINMILSEQQIALQSLPGKIKSERFILSGILKKEKNKAHSLIKKLGFKITEEKELEGWIALSCQRLDKLRISTL